MRRTLPDFAFFQLPIPYSPLCPLSIEPQSLKSRKKTTAALRKDADKVLPTSTTTATSKETSSAGVASHFGSAGMVDSSASTPQKGILQSINLDIKRNPGSRSMTPNLKRRQTVTLMSPRADKKPDRLTESDPWQNAILSTPTTSGNETPPISVSNGYKTPNNYSSPVPSRLRGMAASLEEEDRGGVAEELSLPDYLFSPIPTRRSLFNRVAHLNQDFGSREHQAHTLQVSKSQDSWIKKRRNKDGQRVAGTDTSSARGLSGESISSVDSTDSDQDQLPQDLHWEAIERILFIYAKLNPGVGYVQGMNEILGPLYYLLANDPDEVSRGNSGKYSLYDSSR